MIENHQEVNNNFYCNPEDELFKEDFWITANKESNFSLKSVENKEEENQIKLIYNQTIPEIFEMENIDKIGLEFEDLENDKIKGKSKCFYGENSKEDIKYKKEESVNQKMKTNKIKNKKQYKDKNIHRYIARQLIREIFEPCFEDILNKFCNKYCVDLKKFKSFYMYSLNIFFFLKK